MGVGQTSTAGAWAVGSLVAAHHRLVAWRMQRPRGRWLEACIREHWPDPRLRWVGEPGWMDVVTSSLEAKGIL